MLRFLGAAPEIAPGRLRLIASLPGGRDRGADALVEVGWDDRKDVFAVELKASSQPLILRGAIEQAERAARDMGLRPLVLIPYLSDESLRLLESRGVSGLDLGGNAVIIGSAFRIWRSGAPNRFTESRPLQNPYQGDSSILTRCFLLRPTFESLRNLREFALARIVDRIDEPSEPLQLGTASKVVQALADDVIVVKGRDTIQLVDGARLISNMERRYRRLPTRTLVGRTPFKPDEVWTRLSEWSREEGGRYVATGSGSATHYGVLFAGDRQSIYVDDLERVRNLLEVRPGPAFANVELVEDRKRLVYFDARGDGPARWASPTQTWLELAQGGPREQEAAETLKRQILHPTEDEGR